MNIIAMAELEITIQRMLTSFKHPQNFEQKSTVAKGSCLSDQHIEHQSRISQLMELLSNEKYEMVIMNFLETSNREANDMRSYINVVLSEGPMERHLEVLCVGISSLQLFVEINWTGKVIKENIAIREAYGNFSDLALTFMNKILVEEVNGESVEPVCKELEFLYLAHLCLFGSSVKNTFANNWSIQWWQFRFLCIHQQILTERSDVIFQRTLKIVHSVEKCLEEPLTVAENDIEKENSTVRIYKIFFNLEVSSFYAYYFDVTKMTKYAENAMKIIGMQIQEIGILGKRTKFQQKDLPQFTLNMIKNDRSSTVNYHTTEHHGNDLDDNTTHFPKDLKLDDEVRLNKIKFIDERTYTELSKDEQCLVFSIFNIVKKSTPRDDLTNEQLLPYLEAILGVTLQNQVWALRTNALLERSKLERDNRRTIERALMQIETLVDSIRHSHDLERNYNECRMELIYATKLPPLWQIETELVRLYQSMGSVKSALDLALKLELWEDVIACYHTLKLRHKAAEVIQARIELKGETPLLLCMLGDATDDEACYLKALELSCNKSARAYKALGTRAYYKKDYTDAVDLLNRSLDCNRFQPDIMLRLGYASLEVENWDVAAKSYRMYCNYEPDNFEAWNNLAKAYIKLNNKSRAFTVLQEAVKCDYDNWKVWDNILVISVDCGHFEEAMRAYHRILDIRESKSQNSFEGNTKMKELVDVEVLSALVKAVTNSEILDTFGESAKQLHTPALSKLFGRIAAQSPKDEKFYELFAALVRSGAELDIEQNNCNISEESKEKRFKAAQLIQKATAAFQNNKKRWESSVDQCIHGMNLFTTYGKYCIESEDAQQLISAKMSIKSVLSKVKKSQTSLETGEIISPIQSPVKELEDVLELILSKIYNK